MGHPGRSRLTDLSKTPENCHIRREHPKNKYRITRHGRLHPRSRCARAQPEERGRGDPARPADRDHRPVRLRQVFAGIRHDLRRGPAPLRRIAVGLCAAIPRTDGQARRRFDRGPVAGDLDRAENHQPQSALHGRHGDRDPRLHAPAVGAYRRALFAGHRPADRGADRVADGRSRDGDAGGDAAAAARARGARPQGRVSQGTGGAAAPWLHPREGGRQAVRDRRSPLAEPQDQARDRGGGGPHRGARRHRTATGRQFRDRARAVRRRRLRRERRCQGR